VDSKSQAHGGKQKGLQVTWGCMAVVLAENVGTSGELMLAQDSPGRWPLPEAVPWV
jgi:hypothetical protein